MDKQAERSKRCKEKIWTWEKEIRAARYWHLEKRGGKNLVLGATVAIALVAVLPAQSHEIYTGLHDKRGQLCCGGSDCAVTSFRLKGAQYEFLTREGHWVTVPEDHITFLPVPGDGRGNPDYHESPNGDELHRAHMCYRAVLEYDSTGSATRDNVMHGPEQDIYLYCAFIPPGAT